MRDAPPTLSPPPPPPPPPPPTLPPPFPASRLPVAPTSCQLAPRPLMSGGASCTKLQSLSFYTHRMNEMWVWCSRHGNVGNLQIGGVRGLLPIWPHPSPSSAHQVQVDQVVNHKLVRLTGGKPSGGGSRKSSLTSPPPPHPLLLIPPSSPHSPLPVFQSSRTRVWRQSAPGSCGLPLGTPALFSLIRGCIVAHHFTVPRVREGVRPASRVWRHATHRLNPSLPAHPPHCTVLTSCDGGVGRCGEHSLHPPPPLNWREGGRRGGGRPREPGGRRGGRL